MSSLQENQMPNRLANFKHKGKDAEEMRRRRISASIELRKTSRFDQMLKKRNIAENCKVFPLQENNASGQSNIMTIPEIMKAIRSDNENVVFEALQNARKILSKERNPPIQDIIDSGIVPYLVEFLSSKYSENFQFEACWALTNIASGNSKETSVVLKAGGLPKIIELLESPQTSVRGQATWALGNIAGDGPNCRDEVLNHGALPPLLKLLESDEEDISTIRNVVWTISNLCRHKNPPPPFEVVKTCLPALSKMLNFTDDDILADTCWSLSYLTDGPYERIQSTIDAGVVPRVVQLLDVSSTTENCTVLSPALRTVGNIVTGDDKQTDCVINAGALPRLRALLSYPKLNIVKEAAWSISNITAGNTQQIQAVIDAGILPPLIAVLENGDFRSQKEAAWAVTNFTSGATIKQLSCLLELDVLTPLCNLLTAKDWKTVLVVLDALSNILHNADKIGELCRIAIMIEERGGVDKLEALQNHEDEHVYNKALNIIDQFFSREDGDENPENLASEREHAAGQYDFSVPKTNGGFNF